MKFKCEIVRGINEKWSLCKRQRSVSCERLKMNLKIYLVFIVINVGMYECQEKYYCSKNLDKALQMACNGRYNGPEKKSGFSPISEFLKYAPNDVENDQKFIFPFTSKRLQYQFLDDRIKKDGIVQECCEKPCSVKEIQEYCA